MLAHNTIGQLGGVEFSQKSKVKIQKSEGKSQKLKAKVKCQKSKVHGKKSMVKNLDIDPVTN